MTSPSDPEAIVRGVPIPPLHPMSRATALLSELQPGESRWVRRPDDASKAQFLGRICARCFRLFGRGNYAVRTERNGIRVWRTA